MRLLFALLASILACLAIAPPGTFARASADIPHVASTVAQLTPEQIAAALHVPIVNDALPSPFSDATLVKQQETGPHTAAGATTSVSYSMTYTPGGASTPEASSPRAAGPGRTYTTASITYLIFEEELTPDALEDFDEMLIAAIGDQATDAEAKEITVADEPAWLISIETETNGIPIIIDWIAVPVGKVAVLSMTMSGGTSVDRDDLVADAEALSAAAIDHLGTAAAQRGTPAG